MSNFTSIYWYIFKCSKGGPLLVKFYLIYVSQIYEEILGEMKNVTSIYGCLLARTYVRNQESKREG